MIIRDALVHHLESNQLIVNSKHGFRKGKSCLTNLLEFLHKVTGCVDTGDSVDVIFLDFSKAFDKVSHKRLLLKLTAHGIDGKLNNCIAKWLTNRMQTVCIRVMSDWLAVLSGVPTGLGTGPNTLIYIHDLDYGIRNWILKFADDTKSFSRITDNMDVVKLQEDLSKMIRWSEEWQMLFNVGKCNVMHIGNCELQRQYYMGNQKLEEVHQEKDLGVVISNGKYAQFELPGKFMKVSYNDSLSDKSM